MLFDPNSAFAWFRRGDIWDVILSLFTQHPWATTNTTQHEYRSIQNMSLSNLLVSKSPLVPGPVCSRELEPIGTRVPCMDVDHQCKIIPTPMSLATLWFVAFCLTWCHSLKGSTREDPFLFLH